MKLADLPEVLALPPRAKLQLLDELLLEVVRDLESFEMPLEDREILDERWAAFLADPSRALTLEQFKDRVKVLRE